MICLVVLSPCSRGKRNSMKSHSIFGVSIDDISADELTSQLSGWLEEGRGRVIVTPNAEMLLFARHDALFQKQLNSADLRLPDAVSLRYAVAALTDDYLQHRHTGVDTLTRIATLCARQEKRLLLLGGDPGSAQQAAERMKRSQDSPLGSENKKLSCSSIEKRFRR